MKKLIISAAIVASAVTASADCNGLMKIVSQKNHQYQIESKIETDMDAAKLSQCLNRMPGENKTVLIINTGAFINHFPLEIGNEADQY